MTPLPPKRCSAHTAATPTVVSVFPASLPWGAGQAHSRTVKRVGGCSHGRTGFTPAFALLPTPCKGEFTLFWLQDFYHQIQWTRAWWLPSFLTLFCFLVWWPHSIEGLKVKLPATLQHHRPWPPKVWGLSRQPHLQDPHPGLFSLSLGTG